MTRNPAGRKRYHHGNLRNVLIETALALLETEGVQGLSLREVARRAGVSHAAPYRHFPNKEVLLAAIAEEGFHRLAATTREAIDPVSGDPAAQLIAAHEAYLSFAVTNPAHLRVMFSGAIVGPSRPDSLQQAADTAFALLTGIVEAGQQAGVLAGDDPVRVGIAAWALMHGLAVITIDQQVSPLAVGARNPQEAARQLARILLTGVQKT